MTRTTPPAPTRWPGGRTSAWAGFDRAEAGLRAALDTLRPMSADHETARALGCLALVSAGRGQPGLARRRYREALVLYSAVGGPDSADAQEVRDRLGALGPEAGENGTADDGDAVG